MAKRLSELLAGIECEIFGDDCLIEDFHHDTRYIKPKSLFAALKGSKLDGNDFIPEAIEKGAIAILTDDNGTVRRYSKKATIILCKNAAFSYAKFSANFFFNKKCLTLGVTGTNGKTSVAHFCRKIFSQKFKNPTSIGTLGIINENGIEPFGLTTPDSRTLHQKIYNLTENGTEIIVMETSSHGLHQGRLEGIDFDAVAFTNLTRDHLDYHGTMEAYREAKLRLFQNRAKNGASAVVYLSEETAPEAAHFINAANARGLNVKTVGEQGTFIKLLQHKISGLTQHLSLQGEWGRAEVQLNLPGKYQAANLLVAMALAESAGMDMIEIIPKIEHLTGVPGRMEVVGKTKKGADIIIDYAHTPDALKTALLALKPHTNRNIIVVFGCGGDRDKGKRPLMGEIANRYAETVIITDDNPRTENPERIRNEIAQGAPNAKIIGDRKEAIFHSIKIAEEGDVILIAGKGHESTQVIGITAHPFSDKDVAEEAMRSF